MCFQTWYQCVGRHAKEEFCCRVHGQAEEEFLQVDGRAVARNGVNEMRDVRLKSVKISDLGAREVWSDHGTTSLPRSSVSIEDAMAEDWDESLGSALAQRIVFEVGR